MTSGEAEPDARSQPPASSAHAAWRAYWQAYGLPWRTEPEIDKGRQEELGSHGIVTPDSAESPFKDMKLSRADVEWLLATHEGGRGPVDRTDEQQRDRWGLNLHGADLRDADLGGLPLAALLADSDTHLEKVNLYEARLEGALLSEAHLEGAELSYARLVDARLHRAHLEGASLLEADLQGAHLNNAHLEGSSLVGAHLEGAYLDEAHLEGAHLSLAHLEGAILALANLEGADFREARMDNAVLSRAHAEGAKLTEARLEDASLNGSHLEGAHLVGARLQGADLTEAWLGGKKLDPADLRRVRQWTERFPETLSPTNLRRARFDGGTTLDRISLGSRRYGFPKVADVDWGNVNLAVADWEQVGELGDKRDAQSLEDYRTAVRANRQLAVTLREQQLNEVADHFTYQAQVTQRKVFRLQRNIGGYLISLFSWGLAGYGYKPARTLGWYVGIIFACAMLYYYLGDQMAFPEAVVGSVTAFHGRGLFDAKLNGWQGAVASFEAFCGLFIEVAFILAFTQRFFEK